MSHSTLLDRSTLRVSLLDTPVDVEVSIMTSYMTHLSFTFLRIPYTFTISKWCSRGQIQLYTVFHEQRRNSERFGTVDDDGIPSKSLEQKLATVKQAVADLFVCLQRILQAHQRSVLEYAIWYREQPSSDASTYSKYITLITCHCIVHANFMYPSVQWTLVEF